MREYKGVIKAVGAGHGQNTMRHGLGNVLYKLGYIEIGDEIIKSVKAYSGINGELETAVNHGQPVTLYMHGKFVVGLTTPEGRTFGSQGDNLFFDIIIFVISICVGFLLALVIIGLPFLFMAWIYGQRIAARLAAGSLPNVVLI